MSIFDVFCGRKQNENNKRRSVKLNRRSVRSRNLSMEPLESRDLLSVTTGLIDDAAYAELRSQYPDFNLPELQADLNIMTVDLDEGATELTLADLKSALSAAGITAKPDLILIKTTESANSVVYTSSVDHVSIDIDSTLYGAVTIIGWGEQSFTLDANQQSGVMNITGSSTVVNLGNMTIQNGNSNFNAGGIYVNSATVHVTNSSISNNRTTDSGGGILVDYSGSISLNNSLISNNNAVKNGGGMDIYNGASLLLVNSVVANNSSNRNGGGIAHSKSYITVLDSSITNNTAGNVGGGIYIGYGTSDITTIFSNSTISGNSSSQKGGGIYNGSANISISNCNILDNTVIEGDGGGVYNDTGSIEVTSTIIAGNSSVNQDGGGFYINSGTLNIKNSTVSGNTARYDGGGIHNNGTLNLFNSIVSLNAGCKLIYNLSGNLPSDNSHNIIGYNPGFVNSPVFDDEGNLTNADTIDLHLRSDSIAVDMGDNTVAANLKTDVEGNTRIYSETVDIGAYEYQGDRNDEPIPYSTVVNTLNDSFDLNDDEWSLREAIYYAPEYVNITFSNELEGTIVLTHGQIVIDQVLSIDGDNRIIIDADHNSRVLINRARKEGTPTILKNLTIQNGKTTDEGGGIFNKGYLALINSTVSDNESTRGGGICSLAILTINNCRITENIVSGNASRTDGGGIHNSGTLTISNSEISNNTTTFSGGGIYNYGGVTTITDSQINANRTLSSSYGGGGIFNYNGDLTISDSEFYANVTYSGGAIKAEKSGNVIVTNSVFSNNIASYNGGGLDIYDGASLLLINSDVSNNNCGRDGGGIAHAKSSVTVKNSYISGNRSSNAGGGIYDGSSGSLTVENSVISANTAFTGGGIHSNTIPITVTNCTISGNTAASVGGGVYKKSGNLILTNSIVSLNYSDNISGSLSTDSANNLIEINPGFVNAPVFDSEGHLLNADSIDLHLQGNSVAIDSGDYTLTPNISTDLDGNVRVFGDNIDIGAYEIQSDLGDMPYSSVVNTLNDSFDLNDDEWSLREAIYYASEYVNITFSEDLFTQETNGTIVLTHGQLIIDKALSIDGAGRVAIDADQKSRGIYINAGTEDEPVVIDGLTIQNGNAESGGGVFIDAGVVTIANDIVSDNIATSTASTRGGGGVYNNSGVVTMVNCDILRNTANKNGGGISNRTGVLTVSQCTVSNNVSLIEAGGIKNEYGSVTIINSVIDANTSPKGGAMLFYKGELYVFNSSITRNVATDNGGGIYNGYAIATVANCTISGNSSVNGAGGIVNTSSEPMNVINSIISFNSGNKAINNISGELSPDSHNNIIGSNPGFVNVPIFDTDGVLNNADTIDLHLRSDSLAIDAGDNAPASSLETDVEGNVRLYGETVDIGAYEYQGDRNDEPFYSSVVNTLNDSFDFNDDEWSLREAIYYATEYVSITFEENLKGAIVLTQGQLSIDKALTITGEGRIIIDADNNSRGLYVNAGTEDEPVVIDGLTIQNGNADNGGGIYVEAGFVNISECNIIDNYVSGYGGGFFNAGSTTVTNCIIENNTASTSNGGGIDNDGELYVTGSVISNNTALRGGGLCTYWGECTINNSEISNNVSKEYGGGIYIYDSGKITINNCTIENNTASSSSGGGIDNDGTLYISNSSISYNVTSNSGGGICSYKGSAIVNNCIVDNNTARLGGGIYGRSAIDISDTSFSNNTANIHGGGLFIVSDAAKLSNCTISDNVASSGDGGGIRVEESGNLSVINSSISNNNANFGAGIDMNSGSLQISNSTVSGNTALRVGGGIGIANKTVATITNCIIADNTASADGGGIRNNGTTTITGTTISGNTSKATPKFQGGGGIYNVSGTTTISNSVISNNISNSEGGGILHSSGVLTVTNCTITGNTADRSGAGIYNYNSSANLTVTNTKISNNASFYYGGGIYNNSGSVSVKNTLISGNIATSQKGGGIDNSSGVITINSSTIAGNAAAIGSGVCTESGSTTIVNSIISQNYSDNVWGGVSLNSHNNLIDNYYSRFVNAPVFDSNGKLTNADSMDLHLRSYSAVINQGDNTAVDFETDLDGNARIFGDTVDLGAYEFQGDRLDGPDISIDGKRVTVSWEDDNPLADAVRYRIVGTTRWTTSKLRAGITTYSFNAQAGANYEIEVLLDQLESAAMKTSIAVLDQAKLSAVKNEIKDDAFQVNVTNYAAKNLATNASQAIVIVNGEQATFDIDNHQGSAAFAGGGEVTFTNGLFTFSGMNSNTQYKVQVSFSDGVSVSAVSTALSLKTLKAPYLAPEIISANAVNDTSIIVEWETAYGKNSATAAQKYTVQYSTDGIKWTNATNSATGNSYTIQRLKGGFEYQVRVFATNDSAFDASAPSEVLTAETLTAPKTALDKASLTDETFRLNVTNYLNTNLVKATTLNVKSDKYGETAIELNNGSCNASFSNGMTVTFENGALTFSNAPSNTQQKIQVNFSDETCTTAWSQALTLKTAIAAYNNPVLTSAAAVSDSSIEVEWETAYGKNSAIAAQKYTVQYSIDGTRWTNATTSATGNSYTIQRLKGGVEYQIRVFASKDNAFNASVPSETLTAETLALPTVTLNRNSVTDDSFKINITNYLNSNLINAASINVSSDKFGTATINLQNGSGSTSFYNGMAAAFSNGVLTFTDVPSSTQQKIQVNFSNGVCTTAWSSALTVKTAIALYNAPVLKNAFAISGTSVVVEWETVYGKNSTTPAQQFTVQYSTDGERWTNATTRAYGTSFTITNLKPNKNYLVAVIANKDKLFNASLPSESLLVTTLD